MKQIKTNLHRTKGKAMCELYRRHELHKLHTLTEEIIEDTMSFENVMTDEQIYLAVNGFPLLQRIHTLDAEIYRMAYMTDFTGIALQPEEVSLLEVKIQVLRDILSQWKESDYCGLRKLAELTRQI